MQALPTARRAPFPRPTQSRARRLEEKISQGPPPLVQKWTISGPKGEGPVKSSLRVGALAIALAAGTALVVPLAMPASAAGVSHVICATVSSPPIKGGAATSTFAKCTPAAFMLGGTGGTTKTP